ncbi:MAG: leucine-rich repeat domain-containing protein, partial [Oscillospiraceae bacterium]|nr:leucine-rich repeat domain-containing protein [Oscillospiraceae bacterium]
MKKDLKRVVSVLLCLTMMLTLLPVSASASIGGMCGDDVTWELGSDRVLRISGSGPMANYSSFDSRYAPWYENRASIDEVVVGPGVTTIGDDAFYSCKYLTSVTLPEGLTTIGSGAFSFCDHLLNITFPKGLETIGRCAFIECEMLDDIVLPEGLVTIDVGGFEWCTGLTNVTFPKGLETLGESAFLGCKSLASVVLPEGLVTVGEYAFSECESLRSAYFSEGLRSIGDGAFIFCYNLKTVVLPEGLTSIGRAAFEECYMLSSVKLPESMTRIEEWVFDDCVRLDKVVIPKGITSVGDYAFYGCKSLQDVYYLGSVEQWDGITIGEENDPLNNATIYCGGVVLENSGTSRNESATSTQNIHVVKNTKKNSDNKDKYVICPEAQARYDGVIYNADQSGVIRLPGTLEGPVTFVAKGYVSRVLNAEQLVDMDKVRLQKASTDGPVISAVWVGNVDLMSEEVTITQDDHDFYEFNVEVDWGTSGAGTVKLWQDGRAAEFDSDGELTVNVTDKFDVLSPIGVVATDSDGRSCKRTLRIRGSTLPAEIAYLEGWELSFGDDSSGITLPGNHPIFGGAVISSKLNDPIHMTVSAKEGQIYCALGVDLYERENGVDMTQHKNGNVKTETHDKVTKFIEDFEREVWEKKDDIKNLKGLVKQYKKATQKVSGSVGFQAELTVMGFMKGSYDKAGNITWQKTGLLVNPSVDLDWGFQGSIGPVPAYLEAAVEAELEGRLEIKNEDKKEFSGSISGDVSVRLGFGVGIRKVLSIGFGGRGTLSPYWDIRHDEKDYFRLTASFNLYAKASLGPFTYKKDFDTLDDAVWVERPSSKTAKTLNAAPGLYDQDSYELTDLSYLDQVSYVATTLGAAGQSIGLANVLRANIYQQAEVQIQKLDDGRTLAVWVDSEDSVYDHLQLYYSILDGSSWSAPALV